MKEYYEVLKKNELFKNIEKNDLMMLLSCLSPRIREYKKNEVIGLNGENLDNLGIVVRGKVEIAKEDADGNKNIVAMINEGEMFGETAVFSGFNKYPVNVFSHADSTVLFISPDKIIGRCDQNCIFHEQLIKNILSVIAKKALMLNRKLEYGSIKSMRGKISKYLVEQYKKNGEVSEFEMSMNRNELADFLNVSRPSMSREFGKMRDEGIIEYKRKIIIIKNLEQLERQAP